MGEFSYGHLYVIATLLPLASFLVLFLGGRRWHKVGAYIATGAIGAAFVLSFIGLVEYVSHAGHGHADQAHAAPGAMQEAKADSHEEEHDAPPWRGAIDWALLNFQPSEDAGGARLRLGYYIDGLAVVMFAMVTFIATLIHIFSIGYMSDELQEQVEDHQAHVTRRGRFSRFFMFLSLFCFSMLNLVLADNLFQVFLSWELVGICSYLLISHYYERRSAQVAANKAFITNRVGDAGFIIGLLIFWTYGGTFTLQTAKEPRRDPDTGALLRDAHGHIRHKVTDQGLYDLVRAPAEAGHGHQMPLAGQFVRGNPIEIDGVKYLEIVPDGQQAIIFRGHFHEPEKIGGKMLMEAAPHDEPITTMPYWMLVLGGVGIFLGCVGKSAQFPLQVWLPDAMEGPTPVSALIHAATMVAAGVYLVGRTTPLFAPEVMLIIAYTGAITLFVAATIAIVQTDIKKVLAYSTVSQLGFMMLALGVGGWVAGLFHLLTHAFFKALLFLGSGSVIYGCHHEQEMTKMGGLYPKMKITALTMFVGVLAIAGTPLFSGWYSKDAVLVSALSFVSLNQQHLLLFLLPLLTAGITAFYMFRLWFMTFAGEPRDEHVHEHAHESPWVMTVPLILLAFFSVIVAWGSNPFNVQDSFLEHLLHSNRPASLTVESGNHLSTAVAQAETTASGGNFFAPNSWLHAVWTRGKLGPHDLAGYLALLAAIIGVVLAVVVYYFGYLDPAETQEQFPRVHRFLWHKWYFDELYSALIVRPGLVLATWARWFDAHVIDGIINFLGRFTVWLSKWDGKFDLGIVDGMVNLTANVVFAVGAWLRNVQTGFIRSYILFLAVAAVGIFAVLSYVVALAR
jgi:NADH-quinone oxidoreductase subunit L